MIDKFIKRFVVVAVTLSILYFFDYMLSLSWNYWWFDKVMHFIGGFLVSLFGSLFSIYYRASFGDRRRFIFNTIFFVIIVGLLWEFYELYIGDTSLSYGVLYVKDTSYDLFFDVLGGLFGILYSIKLLNKNE